MHRPIYRVQRYLFIGPILQCLHYVCFPWPSWVVFPLTFGLYLQLPCMTVMYSHPLLLETSHSVRIMGLHVKALNTPFSGGRLFLPTIYNPPFHACHHACLTIYYRLIILLFRYSCLPSGEVTPSLTRRTNLWVFF